jgi:integrase
VEGKFSENVFLAFFEEKSQVWKSSTLWSNFSMIKASLRIKNDVDIGKYHKLIAFLKRKNVGYRAKKSKVLKREHIDRFLNEAPDAKYLMAKVATIFGLFGGLRREELCKLTVDDIEELEDSLLVRISDTKTNVNRSFCIVGSYVTYCRKYVALRPPNVTHRRFS